MNIIQNNHSLLTFEHWVRKNGLVNIVAQPTDQHFVKSNMVTAQLQKYTSKFSVYSKDDYTTWDIT